MIFKAIEFAAKAHAGQYRKGTKVPYVLHPLGAARLLIEAGAPEAAVVAAVLHDTVEDTEATLEEIEREFGAEVAALVEGASEPDKGAAWEARKRHTIEHLGTASREQLLVSVADKLDNIRAIRADLEKHGEKVWAKFKRPREEQAWYYRSLAEVFAARGAIGAGAELFREFREEVERVFP